MFQGYRIGQRLGHQWWWTPGSRRLQILGEVEAPRIPYGQTQWGSKGRCKEASLARVPAMFLKNLKHGPPKAIWQRWRSQKFILLGPRKCSCFSLSGITYGHYRANINVTSDRSHQALNSSLSTSSHSFSTFGCFPFTLRFTRATWKLGVRSWMWTVLIDAPGLNSKQPVERLVPWMSNLVAWDLGTLDQEEWNETRFFVVEWCWKRLETMCSDYPVTPCYPRIFRSLVD